MAVAAIQGANQRISMDTLACRPGESNQRPSDNKTLALPNTPAKDARQFFLYISAT